MRAQSKHFSANSYGLRESWVRTQDGSRKASWGSWKRENKEVRRVYSLNRKEKKEMEKKKNKKRKKKTRKKNRDSRNSIHILFSSFGIKKETSANENKISLTSADGISSFLGMKAKISIFSWQDLELTTRLFNAVLKLRLKTIAKARGRKRKRNRKRTED